MNLHRLTEAPPLWLGEALERFEVRFVYPLGEGMKFRISHGRSYISFFEAMGDATVWVAEKNGEVVGTLDAIVRSLHLPGGEVRRVAYLCDLKVTPGPQAGRALALLARAAVKALMGQGIQSAYSVVMGGSSRSPEGYTGRLDIPQFSPLGDIVVFKVTAPREPQILGEANASTEEILHRVYHSLNGSRMFAEAHRPSLRSMQAPLPLLSTDGMSCGFVDDTRRGKRLWLGTGEELLAVHLSRFAYANVEAGASLVRHAITIVARQGVPAMFFAVPSGDAPCFAAALSDHSLHMAPARIYGCGLPTSEAWSVDTSEI